MPSGSIFFLTDISLLEGGCSSLRPVVSGVPQGPVLGSLLFLILIHNIDIRVECDVVNFVDDTRVYRGVNDVSDCDILQKDLRGPVITT